MLLLTLVTFSPFESGSFCEIQSEISIALRSLLIHEYTANPTANPFTILALICAADL